MVAERSRPRRKRWTFVTRGGIIALVDDQLPTGTVSFLLTDVVGSTRLWQKLPEHTDEAITRHEQIIAASVESRGGALLKSRGEGDSTFSVFGRARDAVAAALDAQRALRNEDWPAGAQLVVRMAIHTGEAVERDGDYFGPVVNRAARLRSIGRGGDVVLSGTTASLVAETLPDGASLRDTGEVALRDLDRPEQVHVLIAEGLEGPAPIGIRMLGPMQVTVGTETIDVGGPKERAVLALLVLEAGPITSDRLIAGLWGDDPPTSARKTLQTYIWRLRQPLPDGSLLTGHGGYELRGADCDVQRFEQMAKAAATAEQDPVRALRLHEQALAEWRGEPFTSCSPTERLEVETARLEELRARMVEGRMRSALSLGRHSEITGDLERLVQIHPLREELWRMLILAQYRSGRQADALRSFQRVRRILVEELGVEPGPRLAELEQDVLHQRIDAPAGQSGPAPLPPRRHVPTTRLVGRDRERSDVRSLLHEHRVVTLTGTGGAGKTRLAITVAADLEPEPIAFCDLSAARDQTSVVAGLLEALGIGVAGHGASHPLDGLAAHIGDRQLLIVADNCEAALDAVASVVAALLARCEGLRVLATSQAPLGLAGEWVLPVGPLRVPVDEDDVTADAAVLFAERAQAARPGFDITGAERVATLETCRRLDGLPLALELAAARMSHLTAPELLDRLDRRFELLVAGGAGRPERHRTLATTIDWSYGLLAEEERTVLRRLAVLNGRFDLSAAEACAGPSLDVLALLGRLVDKSLVTVARHGTHTQYSLLESIRLYAVARLAGSDDEQQTRDAHAAWCLSTLGQVPWDQRLLSPQTAEQLEGLHADLLAALEWSANRGHLDTVAQLLASMSGLLMMRGHFGELERWFEIAIDAESALPPARRIATAASSLTYLHRMDGDVTGLVRHFRRLAALIENFPAGDPVTAVGYASLASMCSRLPAERHRMEHFADLALRHAPADASRVLTMAHCQKARALLFREDYSGARSVIEAALAAHGDADASYSLVEDLALTHHLAGDHTRALGLAESLLGQRGLFDRIPSILAALAAAASGNGEVAEDHLRAARASAAAAHGHPLAYNDIRLAEGALAAIAGNKDAAQELLADLGPDTVSINSMLVLLEHYRSDSRIGTAV